MNTTTQVIAHIFLFSLAFGTQLFSPVVSTRLTGVGFFKLGTSIVLTCLVLALGVDFFMEPELTSFQLGNYILLIMLNILAYIFHRDEKNVLMWIIYGIQILLFCLLSFHILGFNPVWINFFFLGMCLLGISNFSMILGHYYLVVPKLSEQPLLYCLFIFWAVLFLKVIFSLSIVLSAAWPYLQEGSELGDGYVYNWLFVSMRYLWGYVAPFVLSIFTFRLCKMRSIQSATGILYIIEFFVIVGELISIYLMARHGIAL